MGVLEGRGGVEGVLESRSRVCQKMCSRVVGGAGRGVIWCNRVCTCCPHALMTANNISSSIRTPACLQK